MNAGHLKCLLLHVDDDRRAFVPTRADFDERYRRRQQIGRGSRGCRGVPARGTDASSGSRDRLDEERWIRRNHLLERNRRRQRG